MDLERVVFEIDKKFKKYKQFEILQTVGKALNFREEDFEALGLLPLYKEVSDYFPERSLPFLI